MVGEVALEGFFVTLSEADKRKLRDAAALRGVSMRGVVRELIREMPAEPEAVRDAATN
jgi:hypothetical protein